jgi:hypothetical protein
MSLIRLIENFSLHNLRTKKMCHVELDAFPISKNTAALDTFLLKLNVTSSESFKHEMSRNDKHGKQTGLH